MSTQLRLLATAIVFYTRIPLRLWFDYSPDYQNRATRYLPAVGLLVGGAGALFFYLASLILPTNISILLSMAATIALTGAFHEDGFADMCDGFGGGWTPERILEIMKDSRLGTFGVAGLSLLLFLKFQSLDALPAAWVPAALIVGHTVSRVAAISYMITHRYVQSDAQSKVKPLAETLTATGAAIALLTALLPLIASGSAAFWLALLPLVGARWVLGRLFVQKLGGYTGDCLGAAQQVTEVTYYLGLVALL